MNLAARPTCRRKKTTCQVCPSTSRTNSRYALCERFVRTHRVNPEICQYSGRRFHAVRPQQRPNRRVIFQRRPGKIRNRCGRPRVSMPRLPENFFHPRQFEVSHGAPYRNSPFHLPRVQQVVHPEEGAGPTRGHSHGSQAVQVHQMLQELWAEGQAGAAYANPRQARLDWQEVSRECGQNSETAVFSAAEAATDAGGGID
ncbi:hypothetical protein D910_04924 [Dendroctonus ponderosae]|uniref:Uncharacterized protein n=1 Tax=Dendroctonus ponderosae TaxID=77166 RepID=U4U5C6_DENPD|nr:hypothetical protein D910_04924 [Dendroctonus ponderosae]